MNKLLLKEVRSPFEMARATEIADNQEITDIDKRVLITPYTPSLKESNRCLLFLVVLIIPMNSLKER
jgi:hypothetical protein